jgi:sodium/potassium-transporting ATPase subunit alpha
MKADDAGLCVYLKGAPERILTRCSKLLVNGEEVPFTEELRNEVSQANSDFGKLGERVLAFAKCSLPASKYNNDYKFDVKTWKQWGLNPKQSASDYESVEGSFPMHDLTLIGVISLNDPPRPKVDLSVQKCRSAGIKVIMVTGDQPPTAAAIAHKVNILKHPKREFNYMVKDLGMDQRVAWEQATGIVVHGDLLAEKHLEQEHLADDDPQKGQFLQDWSASQKLSLQEPLLLRSSLLSMLVKELVTSSLSQVMVSMTHLPLRRPILVLPWALDQMSPRMLQTCFCLMTTSAPSSTVSRRVD